MHVTRTKNNGAVHFLGGFLCEPVVTVPFFGVKTRGKLLNCFDTVGESLRRWILTWVKREFGRTQNKHPESVGSC